MTNGPKETIIPGGWSSCDRQVIEIQGLTLPKDGGITLDQLQIFIAVAKREHVTRAADALGLGPPSVSAAVASLE
jgi:DNA-binding MarR family transcriptional regulator